eukprot:2403936-Pyramimonas_sp.AAC.1
MPFMINFAKLCIHPLSDGCKGVSAGGRAPVLSDIHRRFAVACPCEMPPTDPPDESPRNSNQ